MAARTASRQGRLLRRLNIFGLDHLDPLVLAALADGRPLLLIGPHGTAKSELLNRLARALGLSHRHYNASLISFDDLLGYPLPNADRDGIEYLRTPADLWDAESVFLDEISRCRPEHQNKLFSIIHERRVQGMPLERLRYCWSAMNPPVSLDGEVPEGGETYHGSLPLDPALADRFAWVVLLPAFEDLPPEDRREIIARGGAEPERWPDLAGTIERTREVMGELEALTAAWIDRYVDALVAPLRDAGLAISGRRAVTLSRNVRAVYAACRVLRRTRSVARAAYMALKWSLPQRAQGRTVREHQLAAVHREAASTADRPRGRFWQRLRAEKDPVRRVALALREESLGKIELSQLVADTWAGLGRCEQYLFARNLLPVLGDDRLTVATLELLLEPMEKLLAFSEDTVHHLVVSRSRAGDWNEVLAAIQELRRQQDPEAIALGNTLYTLFAVERERFTPGKLIEKDREWRALFRGDAEREVA